MGLRAFLIVEGAFADVFVQSMPECYAQIEPDSRVHALICLRLRLARRFPPCCPARPNEVPNNGKEMKSAQTFGTRRARCLA